MNKVKNIILKEGFKLILNDGAKSFTVENLASKLSISKKTLYQYFPTKEMLLKKIITYKMKSMSKKFNNIFKSDPNDPVAQYIKVRDLHIKFSSKINFKRLNYLKIRYPDIWSIVEKSYSERVENITKIFKLAKEKGYLREILDPIISARLLENILKSSLWIYQPDLMLKNNFSPKDIIYHLEEILSMGFFNKKGLEKLQEYKIKS